MLHDSVCILELGRVAIPELSRQCAGLQGHADEMLPELVMEPLREFTRADAAGTFPVRSRFHATGFGAKAALTCEYHIYYAPIRCFPDAAFCAKRRL